MDLTKNQQWDHWYQYYQETGMGADAEIGRNIYSLKGTLFKGYLNGFYFNMKHNDDVYGGGARLTIQPNRSFKISLRYTYDNYEHNTFMVGAQLSFYDLISANGNDAIDIQDLQRNLFVPIERNLGVIGTGTSTPVTRSDKPEDVGTRLEHDNVWFFRSGVAGSNSPQGTGTYEDPFTAFTAAEVDYIKAKYSTIGATIDPYPFLYFNSGNYSLEGFSTANMPHRFSLPADWGMYGWVMYNTAINHPAAGTQRPAFIGGIDLLGGNNSLDSIAIHNNNGMQDNGLDIRANNIYLNNIEVGALNNTTGYRTGVVIANANNVNLNRSQIYGYDAPNTGIAVAYGIVLDENSTLIINEGNSIIGQAMGGATSPPGIMISDAYAYGLEMGDSTVTLSGSGNTISGTATGGTSGDSSVNVRAYAYGLYALRSTITLSGNGNTISGTGTGGTLGDVSGGVYAYAYGVDANRSTMTLSGCGNTISGTAIGGVFGNVSGTAQVSANAYAYGVDANRSTMTLSGCGNTISGTATGGTLGDVSDAASLSANAIVSGLYAQISTIITLSGNGNTISGTATGGTLGDVSDTASVSASVDAYGINMDDSMALTLSGNGNAISGTATGGTLGEIFDTVGSVHASADANGLGFHNSTVTLSGSGNAISGTATGGTLGDVSVGASVYAHADAYGLRVDSSTVMLSGNENIISATATGGALGWVSGTADVSAFAYGLELVHSTAATLSGRRNNISAIATGGGSIDDVSDSGQAYGISVRNGATLDIVGTAANTNIIVNGSTDSWGIFAGNNLNTHLKLNGADIAAGTDYDSLVTYTNLGVEGAGYALEWKYKGYIKYW